MPVIFDNPAGFWALLGIPALLLIHTLQARSRRTASSTLFLLDRLAPESRGGWHWERLRSSLPLWLQLLFVLVLAWVLVAPRWIRPDASQNIVVVLDSSLSMAASLDESRAQLPARLRQMESLAMRTEWTLLESNPRAPTLYRGDNLSQLSSALNAWEPALGQHDIVPSLQLASSLVRGAGAVVFVSDHIRDVPEGAALLSFADPMENCGFIGSGVEEKDGQTVWHALVRNHGSATRTFSWHLAVGTQTSTPQSLTLAAGETRALQGFFPEGTDRLTVVLQPDKFSLDDQLPLLRPQPKNLRVALQLSGPELPILDRVLRGIPHLQTAASLEQADLRISRREPNAPPAPPAIPSIIFPEENASGPALQGWVVAEKHPLVNDTSWPALACTHAAGITSQAEDTALVWRGETPLIFLRQENPRPAPPALLFNFFPAQSNAPKLPAFVILLRRYIETVRAALPGFEARNADTHQLLPLAFDPAKGNLSLKIGDTSRPLTAAQAGVFRAPARAGFFQILQNGQPLLDGAAQFSDVREARLTDCAVADTLVAREKSIVRATSAPDPYRPFWLGLLLALPLLTWFLLRRRS